MKKNKNKTEMCLHQRTEKEYVLGSDTGDRICCDCGKIIPWFIINKNSNSKKIK